MEVDAYQVADRITELEAEVSRLRNVEALKDISDGTIIELRALLNEERLKVAGLKDQIDEMITDMSLMESEVRRLGRVDRAENGS